MADRRSIAAHRLAAQQLSRPSFSTPAGVVTWMGALQAQDYGAAKWAVGLRLPAGTATDDSIERAIARGELVRTHALRGTWQLVAPADVRWLLALVGARVIAKNARRERELGLDARTFRRSETVLAQALRERDLTRAELARVLADSGVSPDGQRLPYLLQRAELDALICGGPRRGKQPTWALLDRLAPGPARRLGRDEALAALARRYFQSRGPATVEDFTWWSGLTSADARASIESLPSTLVSEEISGQRYWLTGDAPAPADSRAAYLLPAFDEYLIGYRNRDAVLPREHVKRLNAGGGMLGPCVVVDGQVIGTWRRGASRTTVAVELELFAETTRRVREAIAVATRRYGAFLGRR